MDPKVNGYQRSLAVLVCKFFNERTEGSGIKSGNKSLENEKLAKEFHKSIIRNFKRRNPYSSFKDNIWDVDLTDMTLISKFNEGIKYFCVLLIYFLNIRGLFL